MARGGVNRRGRIGTVRVGRPVRRRQRRTAARLGQPEAVEVLVLVSPTAIRPAAGDPNGDAAGLEARLSDVKCPTLVVFGQEDRSVQPDAAATYRERIPNCNVAFVYAAGRDIPADRPQALLNLVSDYLERRETFIVQNRSGVINP